MPPMHVPLPAIKNAIREVCCAIEESRRVSSSWTSMSEDDLWRELVACILGSRVRFEIAHTAIERMESDHLFCEYRRSSRFCQYERDVSRALAGVECIGERSRYPFYRLRAKCIRQAAQRFYGCRTTIHSFLKACSNIRDARRRLASEVAGLGPKQASLFLRNIGYATHVAVLDVHVLTYMKWVGLIETPVRVVPSVRKYEVLEDVFIEHARSFGYEPDHFDLAVWIVVKVAKEEQKTWR